MWLRILVSFLVTLNFCSGFNVHINQFIIKYLQEGNVNTVCLLSNGFEDYELIKQMNEHYISIVQQRSNYSVLKPCLERSDTHLGVIIDMKHAFFEEVLILASEQNLFNSVNKWLIVDDSRENDDENKTEIYTDVFSNLNLSINSDVTVVTGTGSEINLYEVYNFGRIQGGRVIINKIELWKEGEINPSYFKTELGNMKTKFRYFGNFGLFLNRGYKYLRRFNFEGLYLRLMIVYQGEPQEFKPEIMLERELANGISIVTQTTGMILHEVASIHNIKFNYSLCDRWVGDYKRESPYAVTNALYFKDIDITPILRFLPYHVNYYDVIHQPVTHVEARYFYRIPTTGVGKFENQFLTPFTGGVWGCVLAIVSMCGVGLLLTGVWERRPQSLDFAFFSVVAMMCQQYFEDVNEGIVKRISTARKLTLLVTGVSCVLIFNYYTSSVVSWLLNGPPPSINSLWELMDSNLQPVFEDVGYTRSWLQLQDYYYNKKNAEAEDELKRRIKKKGNIVLTSPAKGVEMVRTGAFAFHCETNSANKYIAKTFTPRELCNLDSLHSIEKTLLYTSVQKDSPYREFFVWSYARITEQGIIKLIHSRTNYMDMKCEGSSPRALALGGASPAFLVLALGYIIGTCIMIAERYIYIRNLREQHQIIY